MRDYGVVSPKFWIGGTGKALRGNQEAQIVALYLMTSPHANMIGVFYCPLDTIAKETGLSSEGASKGLQSLIEADFAQFDPDTEEVFAVRMAAYQVGEQLEAKDNRCKGVLRELERVMSDRLKAAFRAIYSVAFHLPDSAQKPTLVHPVAEAPSEPLRSQKQEQDQKQGQDQEKEPSASPADKLPPCPHQKLLALYAEHLPMLPQPKPELWSGQRAKHLSARWKWLLTATKRGGERYAANEEDALAWFGRFFGYVAGSDFLTGRSGKFSNCDLGWLCNEENFAKVVQGNYENREAA